MLTSCEVAVEYQLALQHSPQAAWLVGAAPAETGTLREEVQAEQEATHRFIIAQEVEAPERFGAIQSYR